MNLVVKWCYMKKTIIIALVLVVGGAMAYLILQSLSGSFSATNIFKPGNSESEVTVDTNEEMNESEMTETASSTEDQMEEVDDTKTVLGQSVDGADIMAYHYGTGDKEVMFVGGIHGGYSWNTVLVAYELMDYLEANPDSIPEGIKVTVVPVLNPDGLMKTVGTTERFTAADVKEDERVAGRFNADDVDLNRNFDCDWQATGVWQSRQVSGGDAAFSEPEAAAMRDYVEGHDLAGVVVWYSAAGGVFASNCHGGVSDATKTLTDTYAAASGYKAYQSFSFYDITGDMVNWLARLDIPAISVLLTDHEHTEWNKNKAGVMAVLNELAK